MFVGNQAIGAVTEPVQTLTRYQHPVFVVDLSVLPDTRTLCFECVCVAMEFSTSDFNLMELV